jgi:preflagellin peptidase FlaK
MVPLMEFILDAARILMTSLFLLYASWSDYRIREVSNTVWIVFAPIAFILTFIRIYILDFSQLYLYGICFGLTAAFAMLLFYSGGFGGADSKALMCLALALPFYPVNFLQPFFDMVSPISRNFFPITVFSNSVLLAAATAIYMLLRNLFQLVRTGQELFAEEFNNASLGKKLLVMATGYRISIENVKEKWHLYPLEDMENADDGFKRKLVLLPKDEGRDEIVKRLEDAVKAGKIHEKVWATPGLPMLIFITAGLFIGLLFGDIVWIFVSYLLG